MNRGEMLGLLSELIACHSPPGEEGEIDAMIRREFEATGAQVWLDDTTNLYAHLPGRGPRVMLCAHKLAHPDPLINVTRLLVEYLRQL